MKKVLFFIALLFIPVFVFAEGLPNEVFSTNITSAVQKNNVKTAYRSLSMTSSFIENFNIPLNLYTADGVTPLYLLSKNLSTPTKDNSIVPSADNPVEVLDDGIIYILTNGFNTYNLDHNIFTTGEYGTVNENSTKQYITQIALWMYIYQNKDKFEKYCSNDACYFFDSDGSAVEYQEVYNLVKEGSEITNYQYLGYIIKLVDNAKTYKRESSSLSSISADALEYTVDNTNKILKTNVIQPTAKGNKDHLIRLEIALEDPDQYGAYLVNENGEKIEDLSNVPSKFHIVVPLKDDLSKMNLSHISLRIKGYFEQSKAYEYHAKMVLRNGSLSPILYGTLPTEEVSKDYSLKNFVKISTLDPKNSHLAGATMVLTKKGDSSFKSSWVSNDEAHFLQLDNGEYTLCETKAPKGYSACEECVNFRIDGDNVTVLDVKNEEKVEIPNTAKFQG